VARLAPDEREATLVEFDDLARDEMRELQYLKRVLLYSN